MNSLLQLCKKLLVQRNKSAMKLHDQLNVFSNFDIDDSVLIYSVDVVIT